MSNEQKIIKAKVGLLDWRSRTSQWLRANDLDIAGLSRLAADSVVTTDLAAPVREVIDGQLGDVLRLLGHYPRPSPG